MNAELKMADLSPAMREALQPLRDRLCNDEEAWRELCTLMAAIAALSAEGGAVAIPKGFALVPLEPTPTQIRAGQLGVTTTCAAEIYRQMVVCAPGVGADGEWYCEDHPESLMGHDGCDGCGIPESARIPRLLHFLRMIRQELRERDHQYGFLAEIALGDTTPTPAAVPDAVRGLVADWRESGGYVGYDIDVQHAYLDCAEALERALSAAPEGEVRLWDSQWNNVVNHDNCYRGWDRGDAVAHAVKMTEKYIAENVRDGKLPPAKVAQQDGQP